MGIRKSVALFGALAAVSMAVALGTSDPLRLAAAGAHPARVSSAPGLVDAHAVEHQQVARAEARAERRWNLLSGAQRAAFVRAYDRAQAAARRAAGPPSVHGRWGPLFRIPTYAIAAVLLRTGRVMVWGYPRYPDRAHHPGRHPMNEGIAAILDPATLRARTVAVPRVGPLPAAIAGSGESILADGRVFIAGGVFAFPDRRHPVIRGLDKAFVFNPITDGWGRTLQLSGGRWYPSTVTLPDGRVVILGGLDASGRRTGPTQGYNDMLEVFEPRVAPPADPIVHDYLNGTHHTGLYPRLFVMPDGRVLLSGPNLTDTAVLNPSALSTSETTSAWQAYPHLHRDRYYGNAVLVPSASPLGSTRVESIGGVQVSSRYPQSETATTESVSMLDPQAGWTFGPPLNVARAFENTVLLPDLSMVTIGGGAGPSGVPFLSLYNVGDARAAARLRTVELWNPRSQRWSLGPPEAQSRAYHSVALLLPDGRVLSAGDDYHEDLYYNQHPPQDRQLIGTAEIWSPPYLFRGPRPAILSVPHKITWAQRFALRLRGEVSRAVLIAPGAVTHSVNFNQRLVLLRVASSRAGRMTLVAPSTADVAPPGPYMLFVLNARGVPGVAKWVQLG